MHQHLAQNQLEDIVSIGGRIDGLLLQDQPLLLQAKLLQDSADRLSLCYPPLKYIWYLFVKLYPEPFAGRLQLE